MTGLPNPARLTNSGSPFSVLPPMRRDCPRGSRRADHVEERAQRNNTGRERRAPGARKEPEQREIEERNGEKARDGAHDPPWTRGDDSSEQRDGRQRGYASEKLLATLHVERPIANGLTPVEQQVHPRNRARPQIGEDHRSERPTFEMLRLQLRRKTNAVSSIRQPVAEFDVLDLRSRVSVSVEAANVKKELATNDPEASPECRGEFQHFSDARNGAGDCDTGK